MRRAALALAAALSCAAHAEPLAFGLFGDLPYGGGERALLPDMIAEMDADKLAFVVHDGDIKSGGGVCSDAVLLDIRSVFQASRHPLVYVPGDNEWTDCHRWSNGAYDPVERLKRLRELFFADDDSLGRRRIRLERQSAAPGFAAYRENVRWTAGGALFVGMNVPGSSNNYHGTTRGGGPSAEFLERGKANHAWLAASFALARERKLAGILVVIQANPDFEAAAAGHPQPGFKDFIAQLRQETQAFAGRVVLVHGDTHRHRIDRPLADPRTGAAIGNFTRVETYGSPFMGWVRGTVDAADAQVFHFEAKPWTPPQPR